MKSKTIFQFCKKTFLMSACKTTGCNLALLNFPNFCFALALVFQYHSLAISISKFCFRFFTRLLSLPKLPFWLLPKGLFLLLRITQFLTVIGRCYSEQDTHYVTFYARPHYDRLLFVQQTVHQSDLPSDLFSFLFLRNHSLLV